MRKVSTFIGLTLLALGSAARAQENAAAPVPAASSTSPAVVTAAPSDQRKEPGRLDVGVSALAMGFGRVTVDNGIMKDTKDAAVTYGVSVALNYRVIAGLSVGIAPQVIFGVDYKDSDAGAAREYDALARLAYTLPIYESLAVYAEVLPGYSLKSGSRWSRGFVLAAGGGVVMGLTDRTYANIGVGYQLGYQNLILGSGAVLENRENYLRVALGGGFRF